MKRTIHNHTPTTNHHSARPGDPESDLGAESSDPQTLFGIIPYFFAMASSLALAIAARALDVALLEAVRLWERLHALWVPDFVTGPPGPSKAKCQPTVTRHASHTLLMLASVRRM